MDEQRLKVLVEELDALLPHDDQGFSGIDVESLEEVSITANRLGYLHSGVRCLRAAATPATDTSGYRSFFVAGSISLQPRHGTFLEPFHPDGLAGASPTDATPARDERSPKGRRPGDALSDEERVRAMVREFESLLPYAEPGLARIDDEGDPGVFVTADQLGCLSISAVPLCSVCARA